MVGGFLLLFFGYNTYSLSAHLLQEMEATVVDGNGTETGHIIVTTIGGRNGQPKQVWLDDYTLLVASSSLSLNILCTDFG